MKMIKKNRIILLTVLLVFSLICSSCRGTIAKDNNTETINVMNNSETDEQQQANADEEDNDVEVDEEDYEDDDEDEDDDDESENLSEEEKVSSDRKLCNSVRHAIITASCDPAIVGVNGKGEAPSNQDWVYLCDVDSASPFWRDVEEILGLSMTSEGYYDIVDKKIISSYGDGKAYGIQFRMANRVEVRIENSDSTGMKGTNGAYPIISDN